MRITEEKWAHELVLHKRIAQVKLQKKGEKV